MRKQIIFLFLLATTVAGAQCQIKAGTMKIQNYGSHYRISLDQHPVNTCYPVPDSASLRVTVICPATLSYQVNNLPLNGWLDYRLGSTNYISTSVIWWKNGQKKGQSSMPTLCGFFLNPVQCFEKL